MDYKLARAWVFVFRRLAMSNTGDTGGSMRGVNPDVTMVIGADVQPTPILPPSLPEPVPATRKTITICGRSWQVRPVPGPTSARLLALSSTLRRTDGTTDEARAGQLIEVAERVLSKGIIEWAAFYAWADDPETGLDLQAYVEAAAQLIGAFSEGKA